MQVFIILAIVSLVVVFSVMKLLQYRKENTEDCEGEWMWSDCDKKCSGGDSVRYGTYRVTKEATYNGNCEYQTGDKKTEACPISECSPENCEGGEVWSETCEGSCSDGDATLYGKYIVTSKERYLGEKCPYEPDEILRKDCPVNMCPPEDCEGYWEQDEECRDGLCSVDPKPQIRSVYKITKESAYGGASCEAGNEDTKTEDCPDAKCPAEDCEGYWQQDEECLDGLCSVDPKPQIRSVYKITKESAHGGASCEAGNGDTKTEDCPDAKCPAEDCEGYWEQEANCSGPCGGPGNPNGSTIKETFNITKAANSKGTCEFEGQERPKSCPDSKCPKEDCEGYFEPLQLPNCDNVGENEACMSDGSLYRNKNDTAGIFIPPGSTIAMYTTTGPFYGGTPCQNEYENGSIHAVPLSYIETSS
jgi:hypothetical protein